ncbi:MAG: dihydrodipicolinate synthase family protein [Deltaproteobacteria bacterium]|nr:dihydrodipicolinate synthase family protein [Deltaproteobacteria bacterium]
MNVDWKGIMPAITTPFEEGGNVDHAFLLRHARWMAEVGCAAIVPLGSLGEGATLELEEKHAILRTLVDGLADVAPVVPGIAALSTQQAVALARFAESVGCGGLMVLPPYVHKGDDREIRAHFDAVLEATDLPCMLYNNPGAYGTDVRPAAIEAMADAHPNLVAVKESSGDVRRVTEIVARMDNRLSVFVGLDDVVVEGVRAGATGWVAGVINALPAASARLFELASGGDRPGCDTLYRQLLPLLRMDTVPEFVQLIKLMQQRVGMGHERVRPPRMMLIGPDRERALADIDAALEQQGA